MIANVAFLAALTTFLVVAWLAGELRSWRLTRLASSGITRRRSVAVSVLFFNLCARPTASLAGCSFATPAASCRTWTTSSGRTTDFMKSFGPTLSRRDGSRYVEGF